MQLICVVIKIQINLSSFQVKTPSGLKTCSEICNRWLQDEIHHKNNIIFSIIGCINESYSVLNKYPSICNCIHHSFAFNLYRHYGSQKFSDNFIQKNKEVKSIKKKKKEIQSTKCFLKEIKYSFWIGYLFFLIKTINLWTSSSFNLHCEEIQLE